MRSWIQSLANWLNYFSLLDMLPFDPEVTDQIWSADILFWITFSVLQFKKNYLPNILCLNFIQMNLEILFEKSENAAPLGLYFCTGQIYLAPPPWGWLGLPTSGEREMPPSNSPQSPSLFCVMHGHFHLFSLPPYLPQVFETVSLFWVVSKICPSV